MRGAFAFNNPNNDFVKVSEVTSATKAISRAGNNIDQILLKEILERSSFASATNEYDQILKAERRKIREHKESLFDDGFLTVQLTSDEIIEISIDEFLENSAIKKLFNEIRTIVSDAAFQVVGDQMFVFLVATGGGAKLPVVQDLVSNPITKNGRTLRLEYRPAMPTNLKNSYPNLASHYPQLAVAIGGAHPELPEQVISIREGIRDPGPKVLAPSYR